MTSQYLPGRPLAGKEPDGAPGGQGRAAAIAGTAKSKPKKDETIVMRTGLDRATKRPIFTRFRVEPDGTRTKIEEWIDGQLPHFKAS